MITAITGKSGSGKSYIVSRFDDKIIYMDIEVSNAYIFNEKVIDKVMELFNPKQIIENGHTTFCKHTLRKLFLGDSGKRGILEDFLFDELIIPHIENARINNENLIVDGVLPKYLPYFDQVIYVERKEEDRIKDLKEKRNRTDAQIRETDLLQKGMFPEMLKRKWGTTVKGMLGFGNCLDCGWAAIPDSCDVSRGSELCLLQKRPRLTFQVIEQGLAQENDI